jgi:CRISPR/Cas system-associated exonuclease Cas4 (RecB family)
MNIKELLIKALHDKENKRGRSTQVQIGPSELGGCRRKVWYKLNNQPETNDNELKLAAIMGTAIHAAIEASLADNKDVLLERTVEYDGMKAHVDCFIPGTGDVVDWKTVKIKNLSHFPTKQQRWQVQTYGYLIDKSGLGKVQNVNLVAIPRDGDERDILVHSEPYDEAIALEALDWLSAIKTSDLAPEPEKDESYCRFYCKYYDASGEMGCTGLKKGNMGNDLPLVEDHEASMNVLHYAQIDEEIKALEKKKEGLRENLYGISGVTTTGYEIRWSTIQSNQVDKDAVLQALGYVPTKQGKESTRLSVRKTGGK